MYKPLIILFIIRLYALFNVFTMFFVFTDFSKHFRQYIRMESMSYKIAWNYSKFTLIVFNTIFLNVENFSKYLCEYMSMVYQAIRMILFKKILLSSSKQFFKIALKYIINFEKKNVIVNKRRIKSIQQHKSMLYLQK